MRGNLAAWFDAIGLTDRLGLGAGDELFSGDAAGALHATSAVRYPTFGRTVEGWRGWNGFGIGPLEHRTLKAMIERALGAATGLRPEEWQALERRDVDRHAGVLNVRRTVSSGEVVELGKTARSRRQVPLSRRALDALDGTPLRLDTPLIFPADRGRRRA